MNIIKITTDGALEYPETDMSLQSFYELIECDCIETLSLGGYYKDGAVIILDESGKIKGKPINGYITSKVRRFYDDFIVGDVLVCKFDGIDELVGFESPSDAMAYASAWLV